jgi:hypothetical protein
MIIFVTLSIETEEIAVEPGSLFWFHSVMAPR